MPRAIFVQVNTATNRLKYFNEKNREKDVALLSADIANIKRVMMKDYADNFSIFPVYFFNDTDLNKVLAKNYENVFYDKNERPVSAKSLEGIDDLFCIVYYGSPPPLKKVIRNGVEENVSLPDYYNNGVVTLDSKGEPMPHFKYYTSFFPGRCEGNYCYISKKYNVEYQTSALMLQGLFVRRYHIKLY